MSEKKSFLLRVDPKVMDALRRWADEDLRSLNGQIEFLLRRALLDAGRLAGGGARPNTSPSPSPGLSLGTGTGAGEPKRSGPPGGSAPLPPGQAEDSDVDTGREEGDVTDNA